jgi:hypothetical protein
VKPSTKLTEEKQAFQWTPEMETAFQTLEEALCAARIFAYLQPRERVIIDTGASNFGIGFLSYVQDRQELVIACYCKKLNKAERNYYITQRELLAVVRTLEHFHKYLYGQEFHLRTNCSILTWLMSFRNLEGQTARLIQSLQEYSFTSKYRQGQKHNNVIPFRDNHAENSVPTATKLRYGQT